MLAQPFVYFPFLNFLGDMPFMRVKNLVKAAWSEKWKSSASWVMLRFVVFSRMAASETRADARKTCTVRPRVLS